MISSDVHGGRGVSLRVPTRLLIRGAPGDALALLVSLLVALEIGAAVTTNRIAALLPLATLIGLVLLIDARARIIFIVFGGLLTLQSSDTLGTVKLAYLAGVFVSFGGALFALSRVGDSTRRLAMPLLRSSVAVSLLILVSLFVAHAHGIARTDWLRDVAPYALFAAAPVFALDAQATLSQKALLRLLVGAGALATLSFGTHWLQQRHIATLPLSRLALSSFLLPAALFAYASAAALHKERRRIAWLAVAAVVFALLIVTGTRSTLMLALVPVVAAIGARRYLSARFFRLVLLAPVALVVMVVAAYTVIRVTGASTKVISERVTILKQTGTSEDASYADRRAQTDAARAVFSDNPILGAGPGTYFEWRVTNGGKRSAFILDSPMAFPAKFGLVGLVVVGFLVLSHGAFMRSAFRFAHPRPETLAVAAYALLTITSSFLANPLEDKGYTLGLVLLLALVLRTTRD